jgi:hypothetical protein
LLKSGIWTRKRPMTSREAAHILAKARSTLLLLQADELRARVERLQRRSGPRIVFKTMENALVRPRLRAENARVWR